MGMIMQNGVLFSGEPKTTYKEKVLWSGSQTVTTSGVDITLSDNLSEYDEVIFEYHDSSYHAITNFLVSGLTIGDDYIQEAYRPASLGVWLTYTNDTTLNIKAISTSITHTKIIGIKYGDTVKRKDYHVYSTEEQIVGEWIDGNTLYEKTIPFQSAILLSANTWTNLVDVSALSINNLVSATAQASTSLAVMSPYAQVANGMLQAFLPFNWYISLVTLRYTKSNT